MIHALVAINMFLVSATKSSPVCRPTVAGYKGIQVDRDTHFNSNYVAEIQSTSIQDEQLVSGDIRCPGVHAALGTAVWRSMEPLKSLSAAQTPTAREGLQSSQGGDLSCNRKVEG